VLGLPLTHLLDLLRTEGRIPHKRSPHPAAIAEEVRRFEHYLTQVSGLRLATCTARLKLVPAFLLDRFSAERIRIRPLKAPDVIRCMGKYTKDWKASSQHDAGNSLRSHFRFKTLHGESTAALRAAIPAVPQWTLAPLPKGIPAGQLTRLLQAFDRSAATGKRDHAMTRCFLGVERSASGACL
jgi:site-specific recombinase XerD